MSRSLLNQQAIVLLGASGKIGLEIRRAVQNELPDVLLICCSRSNFNGHQFPNEKWIQFDPFESNWDFGVPVKVLINAIGAIAETKEMPYSRVHGEITAQILKHREAIGMPRIVQISAIGANSANEVSFLKTKGIADEMLLEHPDTIVAAASIVCTPNTMLSQKLRQLLSISKISLGKLLVPQGFTQTRIQPILGIDLGIAIARLCSETSPPSRIDLVGPKALTFVEILEEMANVQNKSIRFVSVPREFIDGFVKHFLSVWFPSTINYDQFQLLFKDNVGDPTEIHELLARNTIDTLAFWKEEARLN